VELTSADITQYEEEGYLVVRDALDAAELNRFDKAFRRHLDELHPSDLKYPDPGRYTLAKSCMADPDLAFVVEHPNIVEPARCLLQEDPILTAFVIYDRTPGGPGIPAHNDYKRWRPVGSSMNWLFTVVPLCDFDERRGQLFVAPGSHRLERVQPGPGRAQEVSEAVRPDDDAFVDPELCRGDLLIMNMHCWHRAAPNHSAEHRLGFFNKYAGISCPPATGYYLFNDDAFNALSTAGQRYIAVHSDRPISRARMLLQRGDRYLFAEGENGLHLPGGPTWRESAIPDWDIGNYIASVHGHMRDQVRVETPWASYIGDYYENGDVCRVYGYELNDNGFPVAYEGEWLDFDNVEERATQGYELEAIATWNRPDVTRGKGVTQAQARIDQYAY